MRATPPFVHFLRLADLPSGRSHRFVVEPDGEAGKAIARLLGVSRLRRPRLTGWITQINTQDWRLEAELGVTVTQSCVVTLAPVVTRIDQPVIRNYLANAPEPPAAGEVEMQGDDSVEPLRAEIDLGAILIEELVLALPAYPHAEETKPFEACYAPTGTSPLDASAMRPFAGLAKLRDSAAKAGDEHDGG